MTIIDEDTRRRIREAYVKGFSRNQISKELHIGHAPVQEVIKNLEPKDKEEHKKNLYTRYVVVYNIEFPDSGTIEQRHFVAKFKNEKSANKYFLRKARKHYKEKIVKGKSPPQATKFIPESAEYRPRKFNFWL